MPISDSDRPLFIPLSTAERDPTRDSKQDPKWALKYKYNTQTDR